jgi:hypothetical protein
MREVPYFATMGIAVVMQPRNTQVDATARHTTPSLRTAAKQQG